MSDRSGRIEIPPDDREDIRIAVVLNGGVSLAVWIGGVTNEINRLAQDSLDPSGVYTGLLELTGSTVRVDVIAGTSAGGINGALLGYAQVYGAELDALSRLWTDLGSFTELLRASSPNNPPSLLRGDDYALPQLASAFDNLVPMEQRGARYVPPRLRPVDLIITTTLMKGQHDRFADDFGNEIIDVVHAERFRFVRGVDTPPERDPFHFSREITRRLALAGRCTSSFPIAFEPSFVPIGERGPDELHPDMRDGGAETPIASFAESRFVLDGGVLLNMPVKPALASIYAQPAQRQVRRLLTYVNPNPIVRGDEPAEKYDDPPTVTNVLGTLARLPLAQSVAEELREVAATNARVHARRTTRADLIHVMNEELASTLMAGYVRVQADREGGRICARLVAAAGEQQRSWRREDFEEALRESARDEHVVHYVPARLPGGGLTPSAWDWGIEPVEHIGAMALDVLKRAMWLAPLPDQGLRRRLRDRRGRLHGKLGELQAARLAETEFWTGHAASLPVPPASPEERRQVLCSWLDGVLSRAAPDGAPGPAVHLAESWGRIALGIANLLVEARDDLWQVVDPARRPDDAPVTVPDAAGETRRLESLLKELLPRDAARSPDSLLRRMLAVDVCEVTLAGRRPEVEQQVILQLISGYTPNSFGGPTDPSKIGGVKLGDFGSFYKKSWRVNDWIWGRLDGATRMVQAVLDPARLRQIGLPAQEAYDRLREIAVGGSFADELAARFDADRERIERELAFLDTPAQALPAATDLTTTTLAVARRLHADILAEELPGLAQAVQDDLTSGAAPRSNGARFLAAWRCGPGRPDRHGRLTAEELFTAFAHAGIGHESFADEVDSRLFLRTTRKATAAVVSVLRPSAFGLPDIVEVAEAIVRDEIRMVRRLLGVVPRVVFRRSNHPVSAGSRSADRR
ncbi:patatin-like protein [Microbispora sp. NEAU-D428]|uniref:patatin-like protein n=1 Tax=Microbispora sitophila TaxID=2771537 RepID=UPI0018667432|nr:patatin-like protein [Microbispora sitophila]MBE3010170.1 patatin-like protein [Microbispora sitophila]